MEVNPMILAVNGFRHEGGDVWSLGKKLKIDISGPGLTATWDGMPFACHPGKDVRTLAEIVIDADRELRIDNLADSYVWRNSVNDAFMHSLMSQEANR
jgi:hypothetical protein